jgi:histone H2A
MSLSSWICDLGDKLQGKVAINTMCEDKKDQMVPRHIQLIVCNSDELSKFLGAITIAAGSVLLNYQTLLPKKASWRKG